MRLGLGLNFFIIGVEILRGYFLSSILTIKNYKRMYFFAFFGLNLDLIKNFEYEISDIENYSFLLKKLNFLFLGFTCKSFIILSFCLNKLAISSLVKISKSKLI